MFNKFSTTILVIIFSGLITACKTSQPATQPVKKQTAFVTPQKTIPHRIGEFTLFTDENWIKSKPTSPMIHFKEIDQEYALLHKYKYILNNHQASKNKPVELTVRTSNKVFSPLEGENIKSAKELFQYSGERNKADFERNAKSGGIKYKFKTKDIPKVKLSTGVINGTRYNDISYKRAYHMDKKIPFKFTYLLREIETPNGKVEIEIYYPSDEEKSYSQFIEWQIAAWKL